MSFSVAATCLQCRRARVRRPQRASRGRIGRAGQGIAEFALIVPIMFLLAVGIGDFGRAFTSAIAVESAAREAADYGAFLGSAAWAESLAPWPNERR